MHHEHDTAESVKQNVLYLGADPDLPQRLGPALAAHEIVLCTDNDSDQKAGAPIGCKYQSLILDMALLAPDQTLQCWIDTLGETGIKAPQLVVIAATKDIGPRLQALRANAAAYFVAPVAVDDLVSTLVSACRPPPGTARRVLVVDDDAMQALLAERILTAAAFQVRVLTDPLKILEILAAFQP
jgi:DNA-binding NtrC family response regulator